MNKNRLPYRFTLTLPQVFTVNQLRRLRHDISYITARKRIESALADGTIIEVAKFRPTNHSRGRLQRIYALANVENVQLIVEKAFADKGTVVAI
jgi:hypothetical protein